MIQDGWSRREVLEAAISIAATGGALSACAPNDEGLDTDETPGAAEDTDGIADTDALLDTDTLLDTDPVEDTDPTDLLQFDADAIALDAAAFTYAVLCGSMTQSRARLSTRADGVAAVRVRVWEEVAATRVRLFVDIDVAPEDGGFVHALVEGLSPARAYRYGFFTVDEAGLLVGRSDLGRFRTAPADTDSPTLTVALCSCNGDAKGRYDAFGRIADHPEVDAIMHVGDMAYNDGAVTLPQYRASWATWMESAGYRAALASTGLYATWDDHEVGNDWDPEQTSAAQKAAALQSFLENVPVESGPNGELWRSYRWGLTAEILVLDCRSERLPSTRGGTDDDLYMSRAQMDWLKDRLAQSPCRFKVVMNSVPITCMPTVWDVAAGDRWEGYPKQRNELMSHIRDAAIADVWFLTGDFHVCFTSRIEPGSTGTLAVTQEICVTSGNSNPLGALLTQPYFGYNTFEPRLCLLTFDPALGTVRVQFIDPSGGRVMFDRLLSQTP